MQPHTAHDLVRFWANTVYKRAMRGQPTSKLELGLWEGIASVLRTHLLFKSAGIDVEDTSAAGAQTENTNSLVSAQAPFAAAAFCATFSTLVATMGSEASRDHDRANAITRKAQHLVDLSYADRVRHQSSRPWLRRDTKSNRDIRRRS
jgi:hypothetical protein